ncbi:MAG: DUF2141 domain-containing protein [Endozoicomonas sp.]
MRVILMSAALLVLAIGAGVGFFYMDSPGVGMPGSEVAVQEQGVENRKENAVSAEPVSGGGVLLTIEGIPRSEGTIHGAIFSNSLAFAALDFNRAEDHFSLEAKEGSVELHLDLSPGQYGLFVFHDENDNGDMEMEGMIPKERYAYSNNVGLKGVPSFRDARFLVAGERTSVRMSLVNVD